jgi:hypothetical protein
MPYTTLGDLPPAVQHLPHHAQEIFRAAFNAAWQSYSDRAPQARCIKISPQRDRHGEPPSFATFYQIRAVPGIPQRITLSETWYNASIGGDRERCIAAADNDEQTIRNRVKDELIRKRLLDELSKME